MNPATVPSNGSHTCFTFYDNFAAGSPSTAWVANITGSATRSDGLTVIFGKPSGYFVTSATYGPGTAFDTLINSFGDTENAGYINIAEPGTNPSSPVGWAKAAVRSACINMYPTQRNNNGEANPCGRVNGSFYPGRTSVPGIYSVDVLSATSSIQYIGYSTYSTTQPVTGYAPNYPSNVGFMININCVNCSPTSPLSSQWARVRSAPPNGVMPQCVFGPVTPAASSNLIIVVSRSTVSPSLTSTLTGPATNSNLWLYLTLAAALVVVVTVGSLHTIRGRRRRSKDKTRVY